MSNDELLALLTRARAVLDRQMFDADDAIRMTSPRFVWRLTTLCRTPVESRLREPTSNVIGRNQRPEHVRPLHHPPDGQGR